MTSWSKQPKLASIDALFSVGETKNGNRRLLSQATVFRALLTAIFSMVFGLTHFKP